MQQKEKKEQTIGKLYLCKQYVSIKVEKFLNPIFQRVLKAPRKHRINSLLQSEGLQILARSCLHAELHP